jgi:hypothetical protein
MDEFVKLSRRIGPHQFGRDGKRIGELGWGLAEFAVWFSR